MNYQPSLTSHKVRQTNALTRLSVRAGYLDYAAYKEYLRRTGHHKTDSTQNHPSAPAHPQISVLQNDNGDQTDDRTDFRADQALWSQDNLPDIIYAFTKPSTWLESSHLKEPRTKPYSIYNSYLRDIPILPDHISSNVEGWRIEAWFRFDSRLRLADIIARIAPSKRPPSKSAIQMRTNRFRSDCSLLGWTAVGKNFDANKQRIQDRLVELGLDLSTNSTRGLSWGLKDESLGEAGGRVEVPGSRRLESTVDASGIDMDIWQSIAATGAYSSTSSTPTSEASTILLLPRHQLHEEEEEDEETDTEIKDEEEQYFFNNILYTINTNNCNVHPDTALPSIETEYPPPTSSRPPHNPPQTAMYFGSTIVLKSTAERQRDRAIIAMLSQDWHPVGSRMRRLQLAYLLDPTRLVAGAGFVDNRGFWPPVDGDFAVIDADVIYA